MGFSLGHLIILLVIILLFGGKRLPELGGALGKGLRSFKRGIEGKNEDAHAVEAKGSVGAETSAASASVDSSSTGESKT